MHYLCLHCHSVYKPRHLEKIFPKENDQECLNVLCRKELVIVDEQMVPVVLTLNQKGYKTNNCCAYHYYSKGNKGPYVQFKHYIPEHELHLPKSLEVEYRFNGLNTNDAFKDAWYRIKFLDEDHFQLCGKWPMDINDGNGDVIQLTKHQRIFTSVRYSKPLEGKDIITISLESSSRMNEFLKWAYHLPIRQ